MKRTKVTVVIPVRVITPYLKETVLYLKKQTFKNFEIIVLPDNREKMESVRIIPSHNPGPAFKRNLGADNAKGEILAFLDDDSYPDKDWLKNAIKIFENKEHNLIGVCGPALTPASDNLKQKASGWVWTSLLGAGGAGAYRSRMMKKRFVDDYPSVNLLINKEAFGRVGGFDVNHWPGEDTKLCLDLKEHGNIIYDPSVVVFHHRREVFLPHLKQISRYALRRGYFAKKFPETSMRLGYLLPSIFTFGLIFGGLTAFFIPLLRPFYVLCCLLYVVLLIFSGIEVFLKEKNFYLSLLVVMAIFLTHFTYGLLFPFGYFKREMGVIPHQIDKNNKGYLGG